ncbi:hypothetical protein LCGC14_2219980 [marine sediment metagenome]|uniref:Uncharacterized protein n=1 Tax=marine sediment metagenome TaxID=412755 RepID=A0A0F9DBE1_9ZZZZ
MVAKILGGVVQALAMGVMLAVSLALALFIPFTIYQIVR